MKVFLSDGINSASLLKNLLKVSVSVFVPAVLFSRSTAIAQVDNFALVGEPFSDSSNLNPFEMFLGVFGILFVVICVVIFKSLYEKIEVGINRKNNVKKVREYLLKKHRVVVSSNALEETNFVARTNNPFACLALAEFYGSLISDANSRNESLDVTKRREISDLKVLFAHWLIVAEFAGLKNSENTDFHHFLYRVGKYADLQNWQRFPDSIHLYLVFRAILTSNENLTNVIDWNSTSKFGIPKLDPTLYGDFLIKLRECVDEDFKIYLAIAIEIYIFGGKISDYATVLREIHEKDMLQLESANPYRRAIGRLAYLCEP